MKELSIEEKAKAYDSMFERLKKMYENNKTNVADRLIYERYFPELKESGNIRIIKAIKYSLDHVFTNNTTVFEVTKEQCLAWLEKQGEQNPKKISDYFKDEYVRLKECAIKEKQSAWSVHDEDMLNDIEESLEAFSNKLRYEKDFMLADTVKKEMEWVKSLKDRVQPQPEWSEEDEQYLLVCKNALAKYQVTDKWDSNIISQWLDNKLKSLKPQKQWKPSYEQMISLRLAVSGCSYDVKPLLELEKQLKKL